MNEDFYDKRGQVHGSQFRAEEANRQYANEEKDAREKSLQLQSEQVEFAKRQSYAAEEQARVAEAQREATEQMARQTEMRRQQEREHQRQVEETQRAQLAAIQNEARASAADRDYQRQVLFLKESDDSTKIDAFLEIFFRKLDLKKRPDGLKDKTGAEHWDTERKSAISLLFKIPELPEECRPNGMLTSRIAQIAASEPKYRSITLPSPAEKLQSEVKKVDKEIQEKISAQNKTGIGCLAILSLVPLLLGIFGVYEDYFHFPQAEFPEHPRSPGLITIFFGSALALFGFSIVFKLNRARKMGKIQKQVALLNESREKIAKKLQPYLDEASIEQSRIKLDAENEYNKAVAASLNQWQSAACDALVQAFFDQGLWIGDRFTELLKAMLTEIQRPFPTSCRTDVNNLRADQADAAYQAFTKTIAREITSKISRFKLDPLGQFFGARFDNAFRPTLQPSATNVGAKQTFEQELNQRILNTLEQQQAVLEHRAKQFDFIEELCVRGVLLNADDQLKCEREAWEAKVFEILQTGPSSLSAEMISRPI